MGLPRAIQLVGFVIVTAVLVGALFAGIDDMLFEFGGLALGAGVFNVRLMCIQHDVTNLIWIHGGIGFESHLNQAAFDFRHKLPSVFWLT